MPFQDDERESQLIELFGLRKPSDASRGGLDAELPMGRLVVPFEVKSSSKDSVTTVRDFGMDHVQKWRDKHWLFGFYMQNKLAYCLYGSPKDMKAWISEKEQYIRPDMALAELVPPLLTPAELRGVLGRSDGFTVDDAKRLHKKQFSESEYRQLDEGSGHVASAKMLEVLRLRVRYLISRGSTLNNLKFTPPSGQVDYAAIAATWVFNSNEIGLSKSMNECLRLVL